MTIGDSREWIEKKIETKKKEVRKAFMRFGFLVRDQHFTHDVEGGTLHTWAELIENPKNISGMTQDGEIDMGYFYDEEKQRQHLNATRGEGEI